jgi:hypothetical protein
LLIPPGVDAMRYCALGPYAANAAWPFASDVTSLTVSFEVRADGTLALHAANVQGSRSARIQNEDGRFANCPYGSKAFVQRYRVGTQSEAIVKQ